MMVSKSMQPLTPANHQQILVRPPAKNQRSADAKEVFVGKFFHVWQWAQPLYDGSVAIFESLSRPDTATILALDEQGKIIMTKQEQPATPQAFWSLPGGVIDGGEAVWEAAVRELLEETGYSSEEWYFLFNKQSNTRIDWTNFYFVAKNCRKQGVPALDPGERITVALLEQENFVQLLRDPLFRNTDFSLWWWQQGEQAKRVFE